MIKINSEYGLERDKYQWILKKKTHSKGDTKKSLRGDTIGVYEEDKWVSESFHRTIPQLAEKIANNLDVGDIETLEELVENYKDFTEVLTTLIEKKVKGDE